MKNPILYFSALLLTTSVAGNDGDQRKADLRETVSGSLRSEEICQMKDFKVTCDADEVIVIRSAQLGRLQLGRCIKEGKYEVGCSLDVISEMDQLCSGRRECVVKVDDNTFKRSTNCHQDLKNHLWTTYECVKVTIPSEKCDILRQQSGVLSNYVTETSRCGVTESPWIIEVNRGQRINVTLFDFASGASYLSTQVASKDDGYSRSCRVYATIREAGNTLSHSRTVCGGPDRSSSVFLSSSEKIEIRILTVKSVPKTNTHQYEPIYFLLQFNAVGCSDPVLSNGLWMRRLTSSSDTVTIGCDQSNLSWQFTCKDNEWKGYHGNCSTDREVSSALGMPYAMSTMIIVIIALTVSCVILTIGVLFIKKRITRDRQVRRLQAEIRSQCEADYGLNSEDKLNLDTLNTSAIPADPTGNEYARMRLQRMTDYAGSPPYGYDVQSYGGVGCGYKYPTVEHVYESPDSLRREDSSICRTNPHYMSRIHDQRKSSGEAAAVVGREMSRPTRPSSPQAAHVVVSPAQDPFRAGPSTPNKSKNAGNYSL